MTSCCYEIKIRVHVLKVKDGSLIWYSVYDVQEVNDFKLLRFRQKEKKLWCETDIYAFVLFKQAEMCLRFLNNKEKRRASPPPHPPPSPPSG